MGLESDSGPLPLQLLCLSYMLGLPFVRLSVEKDFGYGSLSRETKSIGRL
jgi:hypothetical protein